MFVLFVFVFLFWFGLVCFVVVVVCFLIYVHITSKNRINLCMTQTITMCSAAKIPLVSDCAIIVYKLDLAVVVLCVRAGHPRVKRKNYLYPSCWAQILYACFCPSPCLSQFLSLTLSLSLFTANSSMQLPPFDAATSPTNKSHTMVG